MAEATPHDGGGIADERGLPPEPEHPGEYVILPEPEHPGEYVILPPLAAPASDDGEYHAMEEAPTQPLDETPPAYEHDDGEYHAMEEAPTQPLDETPPVYEHDASYTGYRESRGAGTLAGRSKIENPFKNCFEGRQQDPLLPVEVMDEESAPLVADAASPLPASPPSNNPRGINARALIHEVCNQLYLPRVHPDGVLVRPSRGKKESVKKEKTRRFNPKGDDTKRDDMGCLYDWRQAVLDFKEGCVVRQPPRTEDVLELCRKYWPDALLILGYIYVAFTLGSAESDVGLDASAPAPRGGAAARRLNAPRGLVEPAYGPPSLAICWVVFAGLVVGLALVVKNAYVVAAYVSPLVHHVDHAVREAVQVLKARLSDDVWELMKEATLEERRCRGCVTTTKVAPSGLTATAEEVIFGITDGIRDVEETIDPKSLAPSWAQGPGRFILVVATPLACVVLAKFLVDALSLDLAGLGVLGLFAKASPPLWPQPPPTQAVALDVYVRNLNFFDVQGSRYEGMKEQLASVVQRSVAMAAGHGVQGTDVGVGDPKAGVLLRTLIVPPGAVAPEEVRWSIEQHLEDLGALMQTEMQNITGITHVTMGTLQVGTSHPRVAATGDQGRVACPAGYYQNSPFVLGCGPEEGVAKYRVAAHSQMNALHEFPIGTADLRVNIMTDTGGQSSLLLHLGGDNQSACPGSGGDGPRASYTLSGPLAAPCRLRVHNVGPQDAVVAIGYSYSGISACPWPPLGCSSFGEAERAEAEAAVGILRNELLPLGSQAWPEVCQRIEEIRTQFQVEDDPGSVETLGDACEEFGIPWLLWATLWQMRGVLSWEESALAAEYCDRDGNGYISRVELFGPEGAMRVSTVDVAVEGPGLSAVLVLQRALWSNVLLNLAWAVLASWPVQRWVANQAVAAMERKARRQLRKGVELHPKGGVEAIQRRVDLLAAEEGSGGGYCVQQ